MKTKIVYVLVSQETDYYYEMLLLSLYSLRLYHPKDTVEVVMDEDTYQRLVDKQAAMLNDVTPIVVPIPSEYTVLQRSRYLKTSLRQIIKGDFLFLDNDTLICDSLADIDNVEADMAMVAECNWSLPLKDMPGIERCKKAGFGDLTGEANFNSGVIYVKDNQKAQDLFCNWHKMWKHSVKNGVPFDQPALCKANKNKNKCIKEIPYVWNYQLFCGNGYISKNNCHILHYRTIRNNLSLITLMNQIKKDGHINSQVGKVAKLPRTVGFAAVTLSDKRFLDYLYSEMISVYDQVPPLFKFCELLSHYLAKPIQIVSRIKQKIWK